MNSTSASNSCCAGAGQGTGSWVNRRTGLLLAAAALGGAALWLGWPWLVVAGIAPILLTLLPCLIMCGAMCAFGMCSKKKQPGTAAAEASPTAAALANAEPSAPAQPEFGQSSAPGAALSRVH